MFSKVVKKIFKSSSVSANDYEDIRQKTKKAKKGSCSGCCGSNGCNDGCNDGCDDGCGKQGSLCGCC